MAHILPSTPTDEPMLENTLVYDRRRPGWRHGPMAPADHKPSFLAEMAGVIVFCCAIVALLVLLKTQLNP